jgi:uridine phosphorylase
MTFPNFADKYSSRPLFSPRDLNEYRERVAGGESFELPESVILCYSPRVMEYVRNNYPVTEEQFFPGVLRLFNDTENRVGIMGEFGFSAPVAATVVEELACLGVKKFINLGIAGTLQRRVGIGDIVVCDRAVRDEGTSYHYVKAGRYSYASRELTNKITRVLDKHQYPYYTGTSWTTDAPYRETVAEVKHYQEEGVLTVEMEASALFAVAECCGVEMGSIFTISDSLAELEWTAEFHSEKTTGGLEIIFKVSLEALSS